jgi:hypothetical protein
MSSHECGGIGNELGEFRKIEVKKGAPNKTTVYTELSAQFGGLETGNFGD